MSDEEFQMIREKVYDTIGVNLTDAKRALVISRLSKRLRELGYSRFTDYFRFLEKDPKELDVLFNLITTNVTHFFRERHHFEFLMGGYFRELVQDAQAKARPKKLRIWSAGCSTGEEPYSIAMVANEFFGKKKGWDIRILASDVNLEVLAAAEAGIYDKSKLQGVPYNYLKKYFKLGTGKNSGKFKVKESLKKLISLKRINLAETDHYPIKEPLDVIFCRNVFIYFDKPTQIRIMDKYYEKLREGGVLFLGHSESIDKGELARGRWMGLGQTMYKKTAHNEIGRD